MSDLLPVAGTPGVFRAKAHAHFVARRDARQARAAALRKDAARSGRKGASIWAATALGVGGAYYAFPATPPVVLGIAGVVGGLLGLGHLHDRDLARSGAAMFEAAPEPARALQAVIEALSDDFHPKHPLQGAIDLGDPTDARHQVRSATSPQSGAAKRYYRHPWLRLAGHLADGSPFAVEATTYTKTKAGLRVWHRLQVRGRLAPRHGALRGQHRLGGFTAQGIERGGRAEVVFWGEVEAVDALLPFLRALRAALDGRGGSVPC